MQKSFLISFLLLLGTSLVHSHQITHAAPNGTTITVNTTDDELNGDGDCSLREAVRAANLDQVVSGCAAGSGADTIEIPAGTYGLTLVGANENETLTGDLDIKADVTISGTDTETTIVDGNATDRIFHIAPSSVVTLTALSLQNGKTIPVNGVPSTKDGGAIYVDHGKIAASDCGFKNNIAEAVSAGAGGAIGNIGGTVEVADCLFSENEANSGGAIANFYGGVTTINDSAFVQNTALFHGGAIANYFGAGELVIADSTFTLNSVSGAQSSGGAVYVYSETNASITSSNFEENSSLEFGGAIGNDGHALSLRQSVLSNNHAYRGGALFTFAGANVEATTFSSNTANKGGGIYSYSNLDIWASTFQQNYASRQGGGIYNYIGEMVLRSLTFTENSANTSGGAIANGSRMIATNITLANNDAPDGSALHNFSYALPELKSKIVNATFSLNSSSGSTILHTGGILSIVNSLVSSNSSQNCIALYELEIYKSNDLVTPFVSKSAIESNGKAKLANGKFSWRVRACNDLACSDWTPFRKFTVAQ